MPGKQLIEGGTGDVLIIPAPTAPAFIRVFSLHLTVSATSTVEMFSGPSSGGTQIGKAFLGTGNAYEGENIREGIMDCIPGEQFTLNNSAGTIAGDISYSVMGTPPEGPLGGSVYMGS